MKPKISTGYFTPQAKKAKGHAKNRLSSERENSEGKGGFNEDLFQALMKCPEKKNMILKLLAANKEAIDDYRRKAASPLGKLQSKKKTCESPTALLRRRALEQMNSSPSTSNRSDSSRPHSVCSEASSSPIPFEKILDGVVAYVEVRSRQDQDRSGGAKAVLESMGAIVRERFSRDVTHVIFKDGSYTTFQRAKLMKIHLVSILWVEFCRKTMQRQNEKHYPAMRGGFDDETMVCSQMQKEYEDIIREEYRQSIVQGTPLPTTQSLIDRRRTLMTPSVTNLTSSSTSFKTATGAVSSQELLDEEVASINGNVGGRFVIMNDPECFSDISGPVVNGQIIECRSRNSHSVLKLDGSDMEMTRIPSYTAVSQKDHSHKSCTPIDMELTRTTDQREVTPIEKTFRNDVDGNTTPKSRSKNISRSRYERRTTICNSLLSSDSSSRSLISSDKSTSNVDLISSDTNRSTNVSDSANFAVPKPASRGSRRVTRGSSSSLFQSDESLIIGKNSVKPKKTLSVKLHKTTLVMSELKLTPHKENSNIKASAQESTGSMSSLRLSSDSKDKNSASASDLKSSTEISKNTEGSSVMSSLRISSEKPSKGKVTLDQKGDGTGSSMSSLQISSLQEVAEESKGKKCQVSSSARNSNHTTSQHGNVHENTNKEPNDTIGSIMSPLQITSSSTEANQTTIKRVRRNNKRTSGSANSTRESDEVNQTRCDSFASSRKSSRGSIEPDINGIIRALETPDFITIRKRNTGISSASKSPLSDDSEILSPTKSVKTGIKRNLQDSDLTNVDSSYEEKENLENRPSNNEPNDLTQDPTTTLILNVLQPLSDDKDIQRKSRRKNLGCNIAKATTVRRRKTLSTVQIQMEDSVAHSKSVKSKGAEITSCDSSNESSTNSDCSKRKLRRLYNPNDSIQLEVDDEKEREEKRNQIRKRKKSEGRVFVNPVEFLVTADKTDSTNTDSESDAEIITSPKRTLKAGKKKVEPPLLNSSADEQKELLKEVLSKKIEETGTQSRSKPGTPAQTPPRRKSTRIIKPTYKIRDLKNCDEKSTPVNRRSTADFMSLSQISSCKKSLKKKVDRTKLPTIVCTKMHKPDVQMFAQIVKKLGRFNIEDEVTDRTTHLVAGEPKRTINMLRAMSRGCWILKFGWVLQSLEEGKWLPEEDFEIIDFSPVVQKCRLERQAFGSKYTMDVFQSCPPIYVFPCTNPRCSDLKELITTCKGKVVNASRMAKIAVGQYMQQEGTVCVHETWVLDCITFNRKMPFKEKYLISSKRKSLAV